MNIQEETDQRELILSDFVRKNKVGSNEIFDF